MGTLAIRDSMRKSLQFAIEFANFCQLFGIPPKELAQMIRLAEMSMSAYERNDTKKELKYAQQLEEIAHKYGCTTHWNGLYPSIQFNNQPMSNRHLPSE